jgi:alpha-glucan,water dikinase
MHRYFRCRDLLKDKSDLTNPDFAIVLMVWLRYSFIRQLTWQKRYNTKPRELQHSQICLTEELAIQFKNSLSIPFTAQTTKGMLSTSDILRQMLGLIGKGSGNGQRVRDEILHIMHRHHISERAGHFYEQWH